MRPNATRPPQFPTGRCQQFGTEERCFDCHSQNKHLCPRKATTPLVEQALPEQVHVDAALGLAKTRARFQTRLEHSVRAHAVSLARIEQLEAENEAMKETVRRVQASARTLDASQREIYDHYVKVSVVNTEAVATLDSERDANALLTERIEQLERELAEARAECAEWQKGAQKAVRILHDREYMMGAMQQMLGPNGLKVVEGWRKKGVVRVHYSWAPDATDMTGEERAKVMLETDEIVANSTLIENFEEFFEQREASDIINEAARTYLERNPE